MEPTRQIEKWFLQYEKDVTNYLVYYTGSRDVEDLVQETFLRAIQALSRFRDESSPKTWLISIARNIAIDTYRKKSLWQKLKEQLQNKSNSTEGTRTEETIIKQSEYAELYAAINQVKQNYRDVILLRGIAELSSKEAGEVLGWTENQVNVELHGDSLPESFELEVKSFEDEKEVSTFTFKREPRIDEKNKALYKGDFQIAHTGKYRFTILQSEQFSNLHLQQSEIVYVLPEKQDQTQTSDLSEGYVIVKNNVTYYLPGIEFATQMEFFDYIDRRLTRTIPFGYTLRFENENLYNQFKTGDKIKIRHSYVLESAPAIIVVEEATKIEND